MGFMAVHVAILKPMIHVSPTFPASLVGIKNNYHLELGGSWRSKW